MSPLLPWRWSKRTGIIVAGLLIPAYFLSYRPVDYGMDRLNGTSYQLASDLCDRAYFPVRQIAERSGLLCEIMSWEDEQLDRLCGGRSNKFRAVQDALK